MSRATVSRSPFPSELSNEPMIVADERPEQGDASSRIHIYMPAPVILRTHKVKQLNCHSWPPSGAARVGSWSAPHKWGLRRDTAGRSSDNHASIPCVDAVRGRGRTTEQRVWPQLDSGSWMSYGTGRK